MCVCAIIHVYVQLNLSIADTYAFEKTVSVMVFVIELFLLFDCILPFPTLGCVRMSAVCVVTIGGLFGHAILLILGYVVTRINSLVSDANIFSGVQVRYSISSYNFLSAFKSSQSVHKLKKLYKYKSID